MILSDISWWTDMVTRGAVPGLPLFEDEGDNPGAWESIKKLFMGQPLDDGVADEYEDYSGAGWGPGEDDGDGDDPMDTPLDDDDILETLVILGIVCLITGLVWFRGQWAAQGVPGQ
jgi:hypothetical protein